MYIDQEDKWKRKIRDYREQLAHSQGQVQQVCELALQALSYRAPSKVYGIFLHERWTIFQIRQIASWTCG
jgi:hypothetical protein